MVAAAADHAGDSGGVAVCCRRPNIRSLTVAAQKHTVAAQKRWSRRPLIMPVILEA
jgi:hypothetical protein